MTTASNMEFATDLIAEAATYEESTDVAVSMTGQNTGIKMDAGAIVYIVIGILGTIDNGIVVVTILNSKSMMSKVCNKLILNQTLLDLTASVFLVINCPPLAPLESPSGVLGEIYCRIWVSNYFLWTALCGSTFNLVAITIERYFEVVHPLTYTKYFNQKSVRIIIAVVWGLSLSYLLVSNVYPSTVRDGVCQKISAFPSYTVATLISLITFFLTFAIPVVIMIICYARMIMALRTRVDTNKPNLSQAEKKREEKMARIRRNLLKTLITVALAFLACWILNQTLFLLFNLAVAIDLQGQFFGVSIYIVFLNSCINPFIYTFNYSEFQIALKKLFRIKSSLPETETTTAVTNAS